MPNLPHAGPDEGDRTTAARYSAKSLFTAASVTRSMEGGSGIAAKEGTGDAVLNPKLAATPVATMAAVTRLAIRMIRRRLNRGVRRRRERRAAAVMLFDTYEIKLPQLTIYNGISRATESRRLVRL
jgi:hypothetical protein